ncbi:MAG: hypothetical protein GY762_19945 [Proteobacteria bacterium]|nr:hypothetical protein [Pseudomonadota bacterium]
MAALLITVETPDNGCTTYRFEQCRVLVGRDGDCDLSIRHAAMPRELCVAWIEDDNCTVRVEERPQLTNPLISGKSIVAGGVSGTRLEFSVGPIALRFTVSDGVSISAREKKGAGNKRVGMVAAGATLITLAAVFMGGTKKNPSDENGFSKLPDSPFCPPRADGCDMPAICLERARLLITRARDLNARPGRKREHRVRAATYLRRAAQIHRQLKSPLMDALARETFLSEEAVTTAYRRDVTMLRRALGRGRKHGAIALAADRVSAYFGACHSRERAWLQHLQETNQSAAEEL